MTLGIRLHTVGSAEQLRWEPIDVPPPGPGEARLRQHAVGLNFIDVYHRMGRYPLALPAVLGQEGAGVVTQVGAQVTSVSVGDRVAYAGLLGAYAEERNAPADRLVRIPEWMSFSQAAAVMLKGMTAEMLVARCRPLVSGEVVVVHAAAGGVGQLLCQWAHRLGARVVGLVGTPDKVGQTIGCDQVLHRSVNWVGEVKALTSGRGAQVVYDSVGKDTLAASLEVLATRGWLVSFGQSSGTPPPIEMATLAGRSLFVTRPSLFPYIASRAELEASSQAVFHMIRSGALAVGPPRLFPLKDAVAAHQALEARATTGAVVLTVETPPS